MSLSMIKKKIMIISFIMTMPLAWYDHDHGLDHDHVLGHEHVLDHEQVFDLDHVPNNEKI
jgi:hypothetical protein